MKYFVTVENLEDKTSITDRIERIEMKKIRKVGKPALCGTVSALAMVIVLMGATEARADSTIFTFVGTEVGGSGSTMLGTLVVDNSFLTDHPLSNVLTSQLTSFDFATTAPLEAVWDTGELLLGPLHSITIDTDAIPDAFVTGNNLSAIDTTSGQTLLFSGNTMSLSSGQQAPFALYTGAWTTTAAVPEPTTATLLLMGFGMVGWCIYRKKSSSS